MIYDGTVPFDLVQPYDGTLTAEDRYPPFTGDDRGTWGGYFDWDNGSSGPDALIDSADLWACTVFLEGTSSPSGYPLSSVDEAPMAELTADIAIRRPQEFLPATGEELEWRVRDRQTGAELQKGFAIVGDDGLVALTAIRVLKDPGIRIEVRRKGTLLVPRFRRGDADGDRTVDLTDPIRTLTFLFLNPEARIECQDAADSNDDGVLDISDPTYTLNHLFLGGPAPPAPWYVGCGEDPTEDALTECESQVGC